MKDHIFTDFKYPPKVFLYNGKICTAGIEFLNFFIFFILSSFCRSSNIH